MDAAASLTLSIVNWLTPHAQRRQRFFIESGIVKRGVAQEIFSYANRRLKTRSDLQVITRPDGSAATMNQEKKELIGNHGAATYTN